MLFNSEWLKKETIKLETIVENFNTYKISMEKRRIKSEDENRRLEDLLAQKKAEFDQLESQVKNLTSKLTDTERENNKLKSQILNMICFNDKHMKIKAKILANTEVHELEAKISEPQNHVENYDEYKKNRIADFSSVLDST